MRPRLAILALVLAVAPAAAQETPVLAVPEAGAQPSLEDLRWVARPLVVFADSPNDPRFIQQMQMLESDPEPLAERRVVVLVDTDPAAESPLRQRLRPRDFVLVLIDTDGSIAHRRPVPTTVRELANFIDRMPSRRQETGSRRR
jgi:hypothetical protein